MYVLPLKFDTIIRTRSILTILAYKGNTSEDTSHRNLISEKSKTIANVTLSASSVCSFESVCCGCASNFEVISSIHENIDSLVNIFAIDN